MEFFADKAITLWGPFAFTVIILMFGIVFLAKYFINRQKHWDTIDENRNQAFIKATKEFNDTAKEFNQNATAMNGILVEIKGLMNSMNTNLIQLNARKE